MNLPDGSPHHQVQPGQTEADAPATMAFPRWQRPLAVVAHPDDESFGLGAVLDRFVLQGASPSVLCFTHGEASTLHGVGGDLRTIRADELAAAAGLLGLEHVQLLNEADGGLGLVDPETLAAAVTHAAHRSGADGLLAFDLSGVTGHRDHIAATRAAVSAGNALGLPVLGWTLPLPVAEALNTEFGAGFAGRTEGQVDIVLEVSRDTQLKAVQAHPSQAIPGSVLWRRLELLGDREHLVWLRPP
ncbi:MAG TPA: PIG-L deacetylase family protein, partial [Kineosporiaceae bacterium]|nr:PIG-L deacetylase family protein [Kineosporiaceae bacterium]